MSNQIKAIKFKNHTAESFTHTFDSIPYTFEAGQEMFLEDFKATHFAKHLVDRELNRQEIPTNNMSERTKIESLCLPKDEAITPLEALQINEGEKVEKKNKKKVAKVTEEFEE